MNIEFVLIQPGEFMMGTPESEPGRSDDEILHKVKLTVPFYMQTTPVTVGQWRTFIEETGFNTDAETGDGTYVCTSAGDKSSDKKTQDFSPTASAWIKDKRFYWENPGFSQTEDHPVTCISWNDAQAFITWLNSKEGKIYRFPTEAEWEYACRAGSDTAYCFGNDAERLGEYAWFEENSGDMAHPVGVLKPNAWGLYDMHGGVWECCQDRCDFDSEKRLVVTDTYRDHVVDPENRTGPLRTFRGGGWYGIAQNCRAGYRYRGSPDRSATALGFRVVKCP